MAGFPRPGADPLPTWLPLEVTLIEVWAKAMGMPPMWNGTSLRGFIEDFSRRVFISEMLEIAVPGFLQPSVTFRSSLLL
ncbi:MAG: hypothetical protein ACI8T1_001279, partial [Verrucomicrobiales bacterium]